MKISPNMESELKQCSTMNDVLRVCNKYYNLDKPLGLAVRVVVIQGIKGVIKLIKAEPKI
jgi:hypothetical protein